MGELGSSSGAALDFTDGDTLKRFTIVNASIEATAQVTVTIQRPNIADVNDPGWIYVANVVQIRAGSFDVLVAALAGDATAGPNEFPNETVELNYIID